MEPEELMEMSDSGETAEVTMASAPPAAASGSSVESLLVALTTLMLLLSIGIVSIRLYSTYGIGKSPDVLQKEVRAIERAVDQQD